MRLKATICLLLAMTVVTLSAQTRRIESLKANIAAAKPGPEKLEAILSLCEMGYNLHPDTLMQYAETARALSAQLRNRNADVKALFFMSSALTTKGLIDSSLSLANECLDILSDKINDPELKVNLYNQKGRCYMRQNNYKEAIDMGYQVISGAENINNVLLQIKGKTLIGWAYLEIGQTKEALQWHLKALHTTGDTTVLQQYGILFANLALNYNRLGQTDSGFYFINKAINYSRQNENLFALSNSLAIQAQLYVRTEQAALAEAPLTEVIRIRKLIGDPFYIVSDMAQLGLYYAHYGQPEKGIALCNEGIAIAKQYKIDTKLFFLYNTLAENYKALGNNEQYAAMLEKVIALKDSVYQNNSAEALAEVQAKYELQKKENLIIRQQLDIDRQHYFSYGLILLVVFASVIGWLLFREYKRRQHVKLLRMQEEQKQASMRAVLKAEEKERQRIAADLHDNLGAYAASIASNLDRIPIEQPDTNTASALTELRSNSQSIVAQLSDTIWAIKKDALSLTAISDRIKVVIQKIEPSYPDIKIDVIEKINTDQLLPPLQGFHIFQTIQEALINALKHSQCKSISITFTGDELWSITIEDDGIGMSNNTTKKSTGGNGLNNMLHRSREAGYQLEWQTVEPTGTKVIISATTN